VLVAAVERLVVAVELVLVARSECEAG
jgi:hypothetical protein